MDKQMITIRNIEFETCFLGRTAIAEAAVKSYENNHSKRIWLPDYFCDTLVYPFVDNGIDDIHWYHIKKIDNCLHPDFSTLYPRKNDIIFYCDFFKFCPSDYNEISKYSEENIIIHDITHSLLDTELDLSHDDYTIASVRKWAALFEGGLFRSKVFSTTDFRKADDSYFALKKASRKARDSFRKSGNEVERNRYIALSDIADNTARKKYMQRAIEPDQYKKLCNIDWNVIESERNIIFNEICSIMAKKFGISCWYDKCLFTVPFFLETELFEKVKKYLNHKRVKYACFWRTEEFKILNDTSLMNISIEPSVYNLNALKQED